jgi:hypothetical protein
VVQDAKGKLGVSGLELSEALIHLSLLPVVNAEMVREVAAKDLFTSEYELIKAQAAQKVFNDYAKTLKVKGAVGEGFVEKYGDSGAEWLKAQGITEHSGFNPKVVQAESTDFYMAKELQVKVAGLSTLPSVADVKKRLKEDKLTASASLMVPAYKEAEAHASNLDFAAWLDAKAKEQVADVRKRTLEISKAKYAILVGQSWFKDLPTLDDKEMTLNLDGKDIKFTVEMAESKQLI